MLTATSIADNAILVNFIFYLSMKERITAQIAKVYQRNTLQVQLSDLTIFLLFFLL